MVGNIGPRNKTRTNKYLKKIINWIYLINCTERKPHYFLSDGTLYNSVNWTTVEKPQVFFHCKTFIFLFKDSL